MRVLLAAHPTVGHTGALVTIGRRLRAAGADVRFALPALPLSRRVPMPALVTVAAGLPNAIEDAGLRVVRMRPLLRTLPYALALPWLSGARELACAAAMFGTGVAVQARALEAEIVAERPAVIAADYLFFPAWLAAERRGIPFVALYHSALPFPRAGRPTWEGGEALSRGLDARLGRARRDLGLPPVPAGILERPYASHLNLLATAPALEGRDDDFGPRALYVGPCLDGRVEDTASFPFHRLRPDACKVYVSLGTVFNGRADRFRALIEGLAGPGVQVVVSAGASFEALVGLASDDVLVFRRVPQLAVLGAVDVVVTHGGNNTVNETLAAGRPLLVLAIGGEQEINARRVTTLGAGLELDRKDLGAGAVRAAFARLRGAPSFGARARAIAAAVAGLNGAETAARLIAQVARGEAPG
jgi:MGT family glycosyltransferase